VSWIIYAIGAIFSLGIADFFRKLGSSIKDPFVSNLLFQSAAFATGLILFFMFSKKFEADPKGMMFALIGGVFISIFTAFSFKALATGPGVSTVLPVMRIGGVMLVALLGIVLLREKLTWNIAAGITLASAGVYLLFLNK
jgi:uncharacterized membrane protein